MPGTPANSPRVGAPRFANADAVDFAGQVNGVTDAFDAKVVIDQASTFATRPAANTVPAGTYHFSTNTGHVARSDGTAWSEVGRALSAAGLTIGVDANLYRSSANNLKSDGNLRSAGSLVAFDGAAAQVSITNPNGAAGLLFGAAADTNLYRLAANQLKTDGQFFSGGVAAFRDGTPAEYVQIGGATTPIIYFGGALDAYIRRWAANLLRIGGALELDGGATKAVGGVENLRTLRGTVNADGTIAAGSGFTVTKGTAGVYTINFSTAFAAVPTPVAVIHNSSPRFIGVSQAAVGSFIVTTFTAGSTSIDEAFSFIATGPR